MEDKLDAISLGLSDAEVIDRILKGEKRFFEVIIRRHNQRIFRVGMSILDSDVEVEDAMQVVYINAYLHLDKFEHRSSFSTWLTRIMINQCFEQKKKQQRIKLKLAESVNFMCMKVTANELVNKELNTVLETAIANLPEKYRLVFILREVEDLSVRETSQTLNIEEVNVKVRLNRAKVMLKESLNRYIKNDIYHFHLSKCDRIVNNVLFHLQII